MKEEQEYLIDIASKVAVLLDGDWAIDNERLENSPGILLNGPEDKILHFTTPYNNTARLEINGIFPHDLSQHLSYSVDREKTEITVAKSKTPEQIARDITKRLMPPYERMLAQTRERKADADFHEGRKRKALELLRNAIGEKAIIRQDEVISYDPSCCAKYYGDGSIKLELILPVDKAVEILRQI